MLDHTEVREIIENEFQLEIFKARKEAYVLARKGVVGEVLEVRCSDGKLETVQTVTEGQMVIWNCDSADEKYAVDESVFNERYDFVDEANGSWAEYKSKGEIKCVFATPKILERLGSKDGIEFSPSWGGFMICDPFDILAINPQTGDLYRIERRAFEDTYRLVG